MNKPALKGFSACIEMLFVPETSDPPERIRLAADAGFEAIEFWGCANKDVSQIAGAVAQTGLAVSGFLAEPSVALTDPANHERYLAGLATARDTATRLGAGVLIAVSGNQVEGIPRPAQRSAIVSCLARAADVLEGTGITLALEPINRIERKDGYLSSTREGLDIVDEVGRAEVKLLYDMYHSATMGENLAQVLDGRVDRLVHVHLADYPGRHEPGTGAMRWRDGLSWLRANGYAGRIGLEYRPSGGTVNGLGFLG